MSFHVYVEPELERKLTDLCKKTGRKRNSLVREALREYLVRHSLQDWPEEVFGFKPNNKLVRFESLRGSFGKQRDDIFADEG